MKSGNLDKSQTPGDRKEPFKHDELRLQQINVPNQEHNNMRNSDLYADTRCQNSVPVIKSDISMNHDQNLQNTHAHSHEPKTNDNRTESRNQCCAFSHVNTPSHTSLDVAQYRDNSDMSDDESESWHCHTKEVSSPDRVARNQLIAVCTLCSLFMVGETVGGVLSNSLALFTDVLHLASDLISFFISLLAIYLSTKPPSRTMSLGYHRAEVLGALFSVFIIWLVTGVLCYMAIERIVHKHYTEVQPNEMLVTASIGVVFNIVMGIVLHTERCCGGASSQSSFGHGHSHNASVQSHHASHHHHHHHSNRSRIAYEPLEAHGSEHELLSPIENDPEVHTVKQRHKNINIRAAFIHVIGDIIQSVGVLIASLIIKITDDPKYKLADPVCTFLFSILVLITTITVLRDTLRIIMEGVPRDLTFQGVLDDLCGIQGVKQVHSLVVWALTIDRNAMAVHLAVEPGLDHQTVLEKASNLMKSKYHFIHTTIQVENYDTHHMDSCKRCRLPSK
ncbi:hypothetical protein FSP39_013626 [Pinctada imbricata]|uniref:Zinc transporter 2-like n=1 Tax=Pinctada imbricata TaxID=66713 RepID=A0AA89C2G2_PINIB|nr:hypothetical protein FSP39_013626 [Pinctada imbricata]